jgi:hypothetical protein
MTSAASASMQTIGHFEAADHCSQPGEQLRLIRESAPGFRDWFRESGMPDWVETCSLISVPYPSRFGLYRAARGPAPFLTITNRMVVIRWREPDGRPRTLLFEPTDHELGINTPFYARLAERTPDLIQRRLSRVYDTVESALTRLRIDPAEVDYLTFDHLHTQDVRRLVGTNSPAAVLSPRAPVRPLFPNAKLLVQRTELEALQELHPLQRPWYQPDTYVDLRQDAVVPINGDVLLGPGVALLATPGHTIGNHSLVVNTATGIWVSSENVIATELLSPEQSDMPGIRRWARDWGQEVVINANTIEATALQYNSCVKEKSNADRSHRDARFLQFLPSSELTPSALNPLARPTFVQGGIRHGSPAA